MRATGHPTAPPALSFGRILAMNTGFLGLQFSFGLQQNNMAPIYGFLGAGQAALPLLQLAGPVTGFLLQPVIGAMSDRTLSRLGRRTPYFLIGAILCSLSLLAMPFSPTLLVAALLLWSLDAGNNITMEPYRAYVSDRLPPAQHRLGFLVQASFTGLGQTLAYLTPSLLLLGGLDINSQSTNHIPLYTRLTFLIGGVISLVTIVYSVFRVRELPLSADQIAAIRAAPRGLVATWREIVSAMREMPLAMRRMAPMCLCQWYALWAYWTYVTYAISRGLFGTADAATPAFRHALLISGQVGAFYNAVAFLAGFLMVPLVGRFGAARTHAGALGLGALGMAAIGLAHTRLMLFLPAIGLGCAWGSMMGNPYVLLAGAVPPARTGVYMGIFNLFIVVPMVIESLTLPILFNHGLGGDPRHVLLFCAALLLAAASFALRVPDASRATARHA